MKFGKDHHLHLIDGSAFIFRAYHALPPLTRSSDGLPIGAVSGFCNMLFRYIQNNTGVDAATHAAVIFDHSGKSFRNDIYTDYKANRPPAPDDLVPQFPLTRDATNAFNISCKEVVGFEADDIIATLACKAREDVKNAILGKEQNQSLEKVAQDSIPVSSKSSNQKTNGREERIKMSRLRQTIAKRLKDSQNTAAMLTTYNEVDMTAIINLRQEYKELFEKKHGVRLGFMSFFTKACCQGLKEIPEVNAEIDGDEIIYKNYVNMGIATGTPTGLVVPVIRSVDEMSFSEIEKKIAEKGLRARDGNLSMADMQDGTFTISNGGVYGSLMSSPILNPPQSGILGMHKIQDRPIAENGEIVIRPMMYLALSYDHRIVDGKGAVTFLVRVKEALEDPRRLLMDL